MDRFCHIFCVIFDKGGKRYHVVSAAFFWPSSALENLDLRIRAEISPRMASATDARLSRITIGSCFKNFLAHAPEARLVLLLLKDALAPSLKFNIAQDRDCQRIYVDCVASPLTLALSGNRIYTTEICVTLCLRSFRVNSIARLVVAQLRVGRGSYATPCGVHPSECVNSDANKP